MSSSIINNIIDKIEEKNLIKQYEDNKDLLEEVSKFIINKKLILYGGLTINLILPKIHRFYKEFSLNDYDCYSKTALKDATELATILKKKGYKYIKIKKAQHPDTFKLYVGKLQILDITQMNTDLFNNLIKISEKERKTLKYYTDKYILIPVALIKRNLYFELSRPFQSSFRWNKIYNRLNILMKNHKNKATKKVKKYIPVPREHNDIITKILKYIKDNKYPIVDNYAIKLYSNIKHPYCCRIDEGSNYISILSTDYEKTTKEIVKLLKTNLSNKYNVTILNRTYHEEILNKRNRIVIENKETDDAFSLINVINNADDCLSTNIINGYTVGSLDTILYLLYSHYIIYNIFKNDDIVLDNTLYYINQFEKYIKNVLKDKPDKRLSISCYGDVKDDFKNWNKRMTVKRIK
jgi:hypothetical protein